MTKTIGAARQTGARQIVVAGGVGANRLLRERLTQAAGAAGCQVFYPKLEFCTDNGAMIAFAGAMRLKAMREPGAFGVQPRWELSALAPA